MNNRGQVSKTDALKNGIGSVGKEAIDMRHKSH
jgi:hypothetical protein